MWKAIEVIPTSKSGEDPEQLTSYSPINLLPVLQKVLEWVRIPHEAEQEQGGKNFLPPEHLWRTGRILNPLFYNIISLKSSHTFTRFDDATAFV